jgi:hypothetical protein
MAGGCRDCSRCTELGLTSLVKVIPRIILWPIRLFTGLVQKKCPQCGHYLKQHTMVGGKFQD